MEPTVPSGELDKSEVHDVLLVGGAANTPKLRELVRDFFDKDRFSRKPRAKRKA